jgi:hypothetical protein
MRNDSDCTIATILPDVDLPDPQVIPLRDLDPDDDGVRVRARLEPDESLVSVAFALEGPREEIDLLLEVLRVGVVTRQGDPEADVDLAAIVIAVAERNGARTDVPVPLETQIDESGQRAVDDVATDALQAVFDALGAAMGVGRL